MLRAAFARVADTALKWCADEPYASSFRRPQPGDLASAADIPSAGRPLDAVLDDLIGRLLPAAMRTDHPRFFAFIPSPASPLSRIGEFLTSVHNSHGGSAIQSEGATAIERATIRFLCEAAGLPEGAGGLFVSGGSTANLAGLCLARDQKLGEEERARGVAYVTSETHASVAKALRILGFFDRQIRTVATDGALRMDVAALACAVSEDRAAGRKPFAVVATAGTTNTGAIDPLPAIAHICAAEGLWLHVDGAYGASAMLSPAHRSLLAGLERADSLAWDAHKWLFQTYGCSMLLVRDASLLAQSFSLTSDYLRDGAADGEPNFWDMGPELTRPARATRLWLTLQAMGREGMAEAIARGFALAQAAERAARSTAEWIVVSPAQLAITAFRYAPAGLSGADADVVNASAARSLMEEGFAVVGTTRLGGRLCCRLCTIHPEATDADVEATVRRLDRFAREAAAGILRSAG